MEKDLLLKRLLTQAGVSVLAGLLMSSAVLAQDVTADAGDTPDASIGIDVGDPGDGDQGDGDQGDGDLGVGDPDVSIDPNDPGLDGGDIGTDGGALGFVRGQGGRLHRCTRARGKPEARPTWHAWLGRSRNAFSGRALQDAGCSCQWLRSLRGRGCARHAVWRRNRFLVQRQCGSK